MALTGLIAGILVSLCLRETAPRKIATEMSSVASRVR
jgi:hypothetical protein